MKFQIEKYRSLLKLLFLFAGIFFLNSGCGEAPEAKEPRKLVDSDSDGYASKAFYGRDCDDNNPMIPRRREEPGNNIDENCNGQVDEVFLYEGPWVLSVTQFPSDLPPNRRKAKLAIDIRTSKRSYIQYIRCFSFSLFLKSKVKDLVLSVNQRLVGYSSADSPFLDNKSQFTFYDKKNNITYKFEAIAVTPTTIKGTLTVRDDSPEMKTTGIFKFTGKYTGDKTPAEFHGPFCSFCYGQNTCPEPEDEIVKEEQQKKKVP